MKEVFIPTNGDFFFIGISTGIFWTLVTTMLILALYHFFWLKKPYAGRLFTYGLMTSLCFALFDMYSISANMVNLEDFLPDWLFCLGKIALPIGLFFNFKMFIKSIPIKSYEAYLFWKRVKSLSPYFYSLLLAIAIMFLFIEDSKTVVVIAFAIGTFHTLGGMMMTHFLLKSQRFNKVQYNALITLAVIALPTTAIMTFLDVDQLPYRALIIVQFLLSYFVLAYFFIICRFILNESIPYEGVSHYNLDGFYRSIFQAISNNEFHTVYQPKLHLKKNQLCGIEALIRWQHPEKGYISPADFIPMAEKSDIIDHICRWVIQQVLTDIKHFRDNQLYLPVSINFSAHNISPEMIEYLIEQLQLNNLPNSCVIIEITETVFLDMTEQQKKAIDLIHLVGIKISMDDFGAGQSSLKNLDKMGLNEVKIDKGLVNQLPLMDNSIVIETIISMCHSLNISVVAEGVNDERTKQILMSAGCEMVQSFSVCPPLIKSELLLWLDCDNTQAEFMANFDFDFDSHFDKQGNIGIKIQPSNDIQIVMPDNLSVS